MARQKNLILLMFAAAAISVLAFIIFRPATENIKIGFIADFSGKSAQMGVSGRNGVLMAVSKINANGGILGHKLELLPRDHKDSKDNAQKAAINLMDQEVRVIIGPYLSKMAAAVLEVTEKRKCLVISPTISTDAVIGIDDYFLRVSAPAKEDGAKLATAALDNGDQTLAIIVDQNNIEYTGAIRKGFKEKLRGSNVKVILDGSFSDKSEFPQLVQQLKRLKPDGILFSAKGEDAAGVIQQYAKIAPLPHLYGCRWNKVTGVLKYGGKTVEGMTNVDVFTNKIPTEKERSFNENYQELFNGPPNFVSQYSYEAMMLFATAAEKARSLDADTLKNTILQMKNIQGISDNYHLNEYGDAIRENSLFSIRDNKYELY